MGCPKQPVAATPTLRSSPPVRQQQQHKLHAQHVQYIPAIRMQHMHGAQSCKQNSNGFFAHWGTHNSSQQLLCHLCLQRCMLCGHLLALLEAHQISLDSATGEWIKTVTRGSSLTRPHASAASCLGLTCAVQAPTHTSRAASAALLVLGCTH